MKRYLLALLPVLFICTIQAQNEFWEEAKGPYGGNVGIIQTHNNVVYARQEYAIHRSDDFGEHWTRIFVTEVDSTDYGAEELIIGGSGIFYKIVSYFDGSGSITRKLFRSTNEGQTWTLRYTNLPVVWIMETLSGALVGIGQFNGKVYRSDNGGSSWQHVYNSAAFLSPFSSTYNTSPDGKILMYGATDSYLLYSSNDGQSWAETQTPVYFSSNYITNTGTLFSLSELESPDLLRSSDHGITWDTTFFNLGPDDFPNALIQLNNNRLLLSTHYRLYTSVDDGLNWMPMPLNPEEVHDFSIPYLLPNGDILGLQRGALSRSSNEGSTWTFSAYGMHSATVSALAFNTENEQFAVASAGLWKTTDRGENWDLMLADTSTLYLYTRHPLAMFNPDSLVVKMGKNIWASIDGGQSFGNITPAEGIAQGDVFTAPSGSVFCTGPLGILQMDGIGTAWTLSIPDQAIVGFAEHPSGDFFAMTTPLTNIIQPQTLRLSQDGGASWEEISTLAIEPDFRWGFYMDKAGSLYVSGYYDHAIQIAISNDKGASWVYKVIPDIYALEGLVINDLGQIFVIADGTQTKTITTADAGESWYFLPLYSHNPPSLSEQFISPDGYLYSSGYNIMFRSKKSTESGAYIRGALTLDADQDCSTPDAQQPLKNWVIALEGENTFYNTTNENGQYTFFVDTGLYTVKAYTPQNLWWSLCDSTQEIIALEELNSDTANFVALPTAYCPLISVQIAAPQLRRCFDNQVYVNYCNLGTLPADSAWVDVMLDPYLSLVFSSQPHIALTANTTRFFLGDLPSGECGQFQMTVHVDCDSTVLGQTHCITAHGFPDSVCVPIPDWSGANIQASVNCQDSLLQFELQNTGNAPSQSLDFIIIEDDVVLLHGERSYAPGESYTLDYPANGHTWRVESDQEPGHPFSYLALAFAEGCGGFNTLGFINQFPVNGIGPSWHRVCVENQGAYDPNDKQGFPIGVGPEHDIRPGQALDYLIRFQNTGSDTAFTVEIRDTLSPLLDPSSIRAGASSHSYTWDLSGTGVITFNFRNILLPDSNVNEAGSHGFVQFSIKPYANVPLGSVIENDAAIYFDFNEAVLTNTTWHTIEKSPLTSGTNNPEQSTEATIQVWPNPFKDLTHISTPQKTSIPLLLKMYNNNGILVSEKRGMGPHITLNTSNLPAGMYWVVIWDMQGHLLGQAKLNKQP